MLRLDPAELPLAREALAYPEVHHRGQERESDHAAFIVLHPLEVASLVRNTGQPEAVVAAAILHDTVEDTDAEADDIAARFGVEIAEIVTAMTEDAQIPQFERRKQALRRQITDFGDGALAVFAADKVAKVRELRAQANTDPSVLHGQRALGRKRLEHYAQSLAMLEDTAPGHPLVCQLRFELEALQALPPRMGDLTSDDVRWESPAPRPP